MTTQEKELEGKINALQQDITELRSGLKELQDHKQQLFDQRKAIGKQISTKITEIKQLRKERDVLTTDVKNAKKAREKLTRTIKEKIEAFKKIAGQKKDAERKHGVKRSPGQLKSEIEKLQYRIETEGLSFEKEQKVMKSVHELEKQLKDAEQASGLWGDVKTLRKEIEQAKKEADSVHETIQTKAKESQDKHEKLVVLSKDVDELKKQEKELNDQIDAAKKELDEKNAPIIEKSSQINAYRKQLGIEVKEGKSTQEKKTKKKLSDLRREVEEKMRKGEKLTTEDFLILQSED